MLYAVDDFLQRNSGANFAVPSCFFLFLRDVAPSSIPWAHEKVQHCAGEDHCLCVPREPEKVCIRQPYGSKSETEIRRKMERNGLSNSKALLICQ